MMVQNRCGQSAVQNRVGDIVTKPTQTFISSKEERVKNGTRCIMARTIDRPSAGRTPY